MAEISAYLLAEARRRADEDFGPDPAPAADAKKSAAKTTDRQPTSYLLAEARRRADEDFGPDPAAKKPAPPRGVFAESASALGAGIVSTAESMGATAEMIGIPGGKAVREKMKEVGESDMLRRPDYLQNVDIWKQPGVMTDWRWWVRSLGENAPNMATMMLPGVAAIRAARAADLGVKAIRAAGLAGSWTGSMALEAGSAYGQAKDEMTQAGTLDPDSIEKIATLEGITAGTVNSLIEMLPFDNLFLKQAGADRFVKRIVRQTLLEGSTEGFQEAVNIYVEKLGHKPDQNLSDNIGRILESGIIGGMMGGMAGGTIGTVEHRRNVQHYNALGDQLGVKDTVFSLKDAGMPDQEIARLVDTRIKDIRTKNDETPKGADWISGGDEIKDAARKLVIPEVDSKEMVDYLLYGAGKYTPPPGLFGNTTTRAKRGVLGMFGMKEKVPVETTAEGATTETTQKTPTERGTGDLTAGPQAVKDIGLAEPQATVIQEEKKSETLKKGLTAYEAAIAGMTEEDQQRLEEARQQELFIKEQEDQQAAAEEQAQTQAAIMQAATEKDAVIKDAAAGDPKKQEIAAEVMGLSDRVVISAVQRDLGLNVRPAGQDLYEIVTKKGAQPVPIMTLRKLLAEKYVADYDADQIAQAAAEKKRQDDFEAVRKRTEEARIKKEKELSVQVLSMAREGLRYGRMITTQQLALLEASRDQLTQEEIARLDAGPNVVKPYSPPKSLKVLGVRGRPAAVSPVQETSNAEEAGQASGRTGEQPSTRTAQVEAAAGLPEEAGRHPAQDAADEAKVREYVLDDLAYQLKEIGPTGWVGNEEGGGRRIAAGGAISRTVKTFGNQSTTPLRDEKGKPVTLKLSKAFLANVIDKARTGKPLTDQQQAVHDVIIHEAKDEEAYAWKMVSEEADAMAGFNPEEFAAEEPATDFNPGEFTNEGKAAPATAQGEETAGMTKEETAAGKIVQPDANSEINAAANEAATSPKNNIPEPTLAQQEAGNFKKGHVNYQGLDISIEYPKDSTRKGVDKNGNAWERAVASHYGYIKRTTGKDGEHVDVYLSPIAEPESDKVFVVDQKDDKSGKFDEHKVMLGLNTEEEARQGYLANYDKTGPDRIMGITEMSVDDFKAWLKDGDQKKPAAEWQTKKTKHPWEMTREQYVNSGMYPEIPEGHQSKAAIKANNEQNHKELVSQALTKGKPVPPEVLKDYPELQKSAPAQGVAIREPFPVYSVTEKGLTRFSRKVDNENQGGLFDELPETGAMRAENIPAASPETNGGRKIPAPGGKLLPYGTRTGTLPSVKSEPIGTWESSRGAINSFVDLAVIARDNIGRDARESLISVVTGKDGKILAVNQHTIGSPNQSQVYPYVIAGQILNVPGAVRAWTVHNHPSGEAQLSKPDLDISTSIADLLEGTGIKGEKIMAVTSEEYSSGEGVLPVPAKEKAIHSIPVLGRKYDQIPQKLQSITGPDEFEAFGRLHLKNGGIALFSSQRQPVAVIEVEDFSRLRPLHAEILREVEKRNAVDFMVYDGKKVLSEADVSNLVAFAKQTGLEFTTVFDKAGDHYKAIQGLIDNAKAGRSSQKTFYSVEERDAIGRDSAAFADQLDDFAAGKLLNRLEPITIGETPVVLEKLGAEQLPLVITQGTVEKATTGKHGVSIETLKQLPAHIADPIMVFDSATEADSLVVMTELKQDGKTIVAAIRLSKEVGRNVVNDIISVHPRNSEYHFINWINQGLLRYMNKSKSRAWSVTSGLQLPAVRGSKLGSTKKILFDHDLVKEKYSTEQGNVPVPTLADVQTIFKGQEVIQPGGQNSPVYVKTQGGKYLTAETVKEISPDAVDFEYAHGEKFDSGTMQISGAYGDGVAHLVRGVAGKWTLAHESMHFLEDAGILDGTDVSTLQDHIQELVRDGKIETANKKDIGGSEDRANFLADALTKEKPPQGLVGKVITRVREFLDNLMEAFGIRTAGTVVRDIETGKIFNRGIPGTRAYAANRSLKKSPVQYALAEDAPRRHAIPEKAGRIIASNNDFKKLTAHADFPAAKKGNKAAAVRLVQALVKPETVAEAEKRFGAGAIYAAPHAAEATGRNAIPVTLAEYYAAKTDGTADSNIVQSVRAFHTGAKAMDRLISRVRFSGDVVKDGRYVLVDDVTTMGGTLAELANHIQEGGGKVEGVIALTNASRSATLAASKQVTSEIERRFGNDVRELFKIEPTALTAAEAGYLIGLRDADTLRNRAAAAKQERSERLRAKGIRTSPPEKVATPPTSEKAAPPATTPEKVTPPDKTIAKNAWTGRVVQPAGRAINRGLQMMIGKVDPAYQTAIRRFANQFREFWSPAATLPSGEKWLAERARGMGNVAKALQFIEQLHGKLNLLPAYIKKTMFQVLDGQVPVETLPTTFTIQKKERGRIVTEEMKPQDLARMIRRRSDVIGQMMVDRGILTEKQFKANEGSYIHYAYAYYVLGEDAAIAVTSTGKLDLKETMHRNPNLTMEQRYALGLIDDASIAVPLGMGKALTDIAKWDYLNNIAKNPDWVWQNSLVKVPVGVPLKKDQSGRTRRLVNMTVGSLTETIKKYEEMNRVQPTPEVQEQLRIYKEALAKVEEALKNIPEGYKQLPQGKNYGPLAGAYVRETIYNDIVPVLGQLNADMGKAMRTFLELEAKAVSAFKFGKVAVNFPTAFRNMVSNFIQINMSGRPFYKIPGDVISAAESMRAKDVYYEEAFGMGIFHTNWFLTEINDVLNEFRKAQGGGIDKFFIAVKNLGKYYGKIDDISKFAIFLQQRKEGKSIDESAVHALKWGMDYSLASRSIKAARRHLIPFASYNYKIAPLIAESLRDRPWVLAKYAMLLPLALKMLAKNYNDLDDEDMKDLEKQLPAYTKKSGSMMILPFKTDKGQYQWLNAEYFLPWGNWFNIFRDMKDKDVGELTRDVGITHPLLDIMTMFRSARDGSPPMHPFFGKPIYNELDHPAMKIAKMAHQLAFTFLPSMISPIEGALGYTIDAVRGKEDRWGREVTPAQAAGRWLGFNVVSVSPEQSAAIAGVRIQELKKEFSRMDADPSISDERKAAAKERMQESIAGYAWENPTSVLPIQKKKGNDPVFTALVEMVKKGILKTGPPGRSIEIAGTPYKMTLDQQREYFDKSSEIAHRKLEGLVTSPAWTTMPDKRKTEVVSHIMENARKGVRQKIKGEIARTNREKLAASSSATGE
ncbi:MAG: hypothetical protein NT047_07485 [Deltaproteobacteria bacterium]|nr:hypothetical protein [Deltaproteobacteria bacterium]